MKDHKVDIAVIGAGYWGPNLIRTLLTIDGCRVAWICEESVGRQAYVRQTFPTVPVTPHLDEVLSDSTIDAVFIATPVSTHYKVAAAALTAGKHIFVEKPLASNADDAHRLVSLAERLDRTLAVGHIFAFHPAITKLKDMAEEGRIGDLRYAESDRVNMGPPGSKVDVIWDLAVHDVAIMIHILEAEPVEVVAFGRPCSHAKLIDVALIRLHFERDFFSHHHVSWLSPDKVRRLSLFGVAGSLTFDDSALENKLRFVGCGIDTRVGLMDTDVKELIYKPGSIEYPQLANEQPLRVECEDFLRSVRTGSSPSVGGRAGLSVVRVLECAERSIAQNSRPIRLQEVMTYAET